MKPAISVSNLSKQYTLGSESIAGQSFRELILNSLNSPLKKFNRLGGKDAQAETFWALKDINFSVNTGEVVGVIGRNGAGKSTLLKVMSRITTPTQGRIEYIGKMASLLEVGTGFHPELSGRENIYLNGAILGMSRQTITQRLDDIIAFAEIEKFIDTPVKRYSSGMYVRLAFSVAAHLDTEILIVDEVLAVGDQAFQQKCLGKLKDTANSGRTVFFVSHNMTAVKSLCTRILYLKNGQIVADGNPQDAIGEYLKTDQSNAQAWEDTANDNRFLKKVELCTNGASDTNVIQYHQQAEVAITVENANVQQHAIGLRLTDVFGNPVFTSLAQDSLASVEGQLNGRNKFVCELPENLLKPGAYNLSALVRYPNRRGVPVEEEANIEIIVSNEQCPIPDGRLGVISPILQWRRCA